MSLNIGDKIPEFKLTDQNGKVFDINSVKGKNSLVIYFYPKNFTPGCTLEACSFRDSYEDFKELGAQVIGISADSKKSHERFAKKYHLLFTLLSDSNGAVKRKFRVKNNLFGLIPGRETFVVNKKGIVIFTFNSMNAERHIKEALKVLKQQED
ncbi:peroxiredoxin [Planktosalinus lacus]|uniref:thioredoxin-dependent peroxiredoxin n=1 Tax=Planktosalinus lacus TaxID=1526573 RepID=A0A8J2VBD4_9FLAO|nr:peroxiredoxin [Planktosalinus lacus]GGE00714.1 peroxiredoxin [Planktosalinus lacus]